jgi:Tfp pilus assembly PilM family ATPase
MASACGIHIDQRRFRLIALEGSAKKHRIVAHAAGEIMPGEDPVTVVAAALRAAVKGQKIRRESVGLAVSSGLAAFRHLTLPFDDRSKIEEVIKYEVETDLPHWNIEDIVVDFLVTDEKPGVQSDLLVTAIPKKHLAPKLAACERGGLEAGETELDGTALFDVAFEAGLLDSESAQVLVFVGDASTTVVVADGGKLVSIRAIRAGAQPPIAAESAETGAESEESGEESGDEADPLREEPSSLAPDPKRLASTIGRIRRELGRTISGARTANPIETVYLCGRELPGFADEEVFDVPVVPLEALPNSSEIPGASEAIVAYGTALHQLGGGVLRPHLRREDLRFTGKFERIELPLAVFSLLLVTLLAVQFIVVRQQLNWRDRDLQTWLEVSNSFMLPNAERGYSGRIKNPSEELLDYCRTAAANEDLDRTKWEQIDHVRGILTEEIGTLQTQLGQIREFEQPPSALQAFTLVMSLIDLQGERVGRIGIRSVAADYVRRSGEDDLIVLKLSADFFAEDALVATAHYTNLRSAIEAEAWCVEFEEKPTKPLEEGTGIFVDNMTIHVNLKAAMPEEGA